MKARPGMRDRRTKMTIMMLVEIVCVVIVCSLGSAISTPTQISLAYGEKTSEMVVTFAVTDSSASDYVCQYGSTENHWDRFIYTYVNASGSSYTMGSYTSPLLLQATMTNLEKGNKNYYYRVGSPTEGFSDVFSFKSNPGVGDFPTAFHIVGDVGQTNNRYCRTDEQ